MNVAISCQCGWVGIAPTFSESAKDQLYHQLSKGEGHSALTHTNVAERMGNAEFSILRQVAHQDSLDYRAKQQVQGREEYRSRRKEDSPLYVDTMDDGLGCARGCWSALQILGGMFGRCFGCVVRGESMKSEYQTRKGERDAN